MNIFKLTAILCMPMFLASCGNPGGISDEEYAKYNELGAPKILYSCTSNKDSWFAVCHLKKTYNECSEEFMKLDSSSPELIEHTRVGYSAGIGMASTYNKLLTDAKEECEGEFKVLESKE
jgi:hypothetical protein